MQRLPKGSPSADHEDEDDELDKLDTLIAGTTAPEHELTVTDQRSSDEEEKSKYR